MKFIIVGKHGSGKLEVLNRLESLGIKVGREFSNIQSAPDNLYIDPKYEHYSLDDINNMVEMHSYICLSGIEDKGVIDSYSLYRGLSFYTFDTSDVIMLNPQQVLDINHQSVRTDVVFVWLDCTRDNRIRRYAQEERKYDFMNREEIDSRNDSEFCKTILNFPKSSMLYFQNEEPERVAAIIYSILKHPDLLDIFIKSFN